MIPLIGEAIPDNVVVAIAAAISAVGSTLIASRIKRLMSRDESLLRGYDSFATRLNSRVDILEKELDRRETEYRRMISDADARHRQCEMECARLRSRVEDLERRLGRPDLAPE